MARPTSRGLEYTYLDKNFFFDRKVKRLQRKCGADAPYVFIALLCLIAPEGYYIKYDNDAVYDLADMTGFDEDRVAQILDTCGEVGLLDNDLMVREHLLTSHGIQKYYATTCTQLKRKAGVEEFSLLDGPIERVSPEETPKNNGNQEFLPNKPEEIPTKGKERKGKEYKGKKDKGNSSSFSPSSSPSVESSEEQQQEKILSHMFFSGWAAPSQELKKFIAFNNTGGRVWGKMSDSERYAALTLWKQQPEQPVRLGRPFLAMWEQVYAQMVRSRAPDDIRLDALSDALTWSVSPDNYLTLHCSEALSLYIEQEMDDYKPILGRYLSENKYAGLRYQYIDKHTKP